MKISKQKSISGMYNSEIKPICDPVLYKELMKVEKRYAGDKYILSKLSDCLVNSEYDMINPLVPFPAGYLMAVVFLDKKIIFYDAGSEPRRNKKTIRRSFCIVK